MPDTTGRRVWLWLLPPHLGDCLCAAALIRASIALFDGALDLDVVTPQALQPLLAGVTGVRNAFHYDAEASALPDYDWVIDLSIGPLGVRFAEALRFKHLIRRDLAATTIIRVLDAGGEAACAIPSPTFDEAGSGPGSSPDLPIWALHAPLIAYAAGCDFWSWFARLRRLRVEMRGRSFEEAKPDGDNPTVMLVACASQAAKRWPEARWIEFAEAGRAAGWTLILVVGPSERGALRALRGLAGLPVCDSMELSNLGHLMRRQDLVVANDCGPMHLAASQGVATLAVFGPTNPRCWFFYDGENQRALQTAEPHDRWSRMDDPNCAWPEWPSAASVFAAAKRMIGDGRSRRHV